MIELYIALLFVLLIVTIILCLGNFIIWITGGGEEVDEVIEGRPFPYVEYRGRYFPVLHSEYNRLWIEDPEREMSDSVDELINVSLVHEDRAVGSYVAHEDGTAFLTHWGK